MKIKKSLKRGRANPKVKVRTAKGRKQSSTRWLERQLNDPYVQMAQTDGYRGRAAYKLIEMDDRLKFLFAGARVIDLGCAPGSWSQVAIARTNSCGIRKNFPRGCVIGVDVLEVEPVPGAKFLKMDFLSDHSFEVLSNVLGSKADIVLSDMAAPSTGHARTDRLRVMYLCQTAADLSFDILAQGGSFVSKILEGGVDGNLQKSLKNKFERVYNVKPPASRSGSSEKYLVAIGYRGQGIPVIKHPPRSLSN